LNDRLEKRSGEGSRTRSAIMDRYSHLLPKLKGHDLGTLHSKWPSSTTTYAQPIAAMMSAARSTPAPTFQSSMTFRKMGEVSGLPSNEFTPFRPRHKRRKWEESEEAEAAPTFETEKDNLSFAPISKRSRLEIDASPAPTPKRATSAMKSLANQSSILSVLTTPLIDRRAGSILSRSHLASSILEGSERTMTPHSILKVKGAMSSLQTDSPLSTLFTASRRRTITMEDEEEESDDNWLVKHRQRASVSRESTPGKSLRFNVPKRLPPLEVVTPDESSCEPSIVSAEVSKEISPEISPAKQVQERVEPPSQRRPEDDDSIVLISDEDDELEQEEQREEQSEAESEIEQLYVEDEEQEPEEAESEVEEVDNEEEAESEVEEVDNEEEEAYQSFSSPEVSTKNVVDHSMYGPHETLAVDVSFARNLTTLDSNSSLNQTTANQTPRFGERSVVFGLAQHERVAETTMYGPNVTMEIDVDLARALATQDSETNVTHNVTHNSTQNVTTYGAEMDQSVLSSGSSNKGSNVTMYGHEETMPIDVSFARHLAQQDAEEVLEEDSFCIPKTPKAVDRSAILGRSFSGDRVSETTMYGLSDVTMPADVSLVRRLAKSDKEEEVENEETIEETSFAGDVSIVDLDDMEKTKTDSSISGPTLSETTEKSRFSFAEPKELIIEATTGQETAEEVTETNRSGEFKFDEPQLISVSERDQEVELKSAESSMVTLEEEEEIADFDLVKALAQKDLVATPAKSSASFSTTLEPVFEEEDSGEITFKTATAEDSGEITFKTTPKPVPESTKKRKPRFSESFAASASQLGPIVEEDVSTPTSFFMGKDERFRTKSLSVDSPSGRIRSSSVTHPSPSVKRRNRSSQSVSDISTIQQEEEFKIGEDNVAVKSAAQSQVQEAKEEEIEVFAAVGSPKKTDEPVEVVPTEESTPEYVLDQSVEVQSIPECTAEPETLSEALATPEKVKTPTKPQATPDKEEASLAVTQTLPEEVKTQTTPEKETTLPSATAMPEEVTTPTKTQATPEKMEALATPEKMEAQATPEKMEAQATLEMMQTQVTSLKMETPPKTPEKEKSSVSPKTVGSSRTRTRSQMSESESELIKLSQVPATSDNTDGSQEKSLTGKVNTSVLESTLSKSEVTSQPRLTRKSSASISLASPMIIVGSRRRTRSTLSESEPEPLKGVTPSRRSRKDQKEEEQKPSEPDESTTVIESSKRKRTTSDHDTELSPERKSSRLEERRASVESPLRSPKPVVEGSSKKKKSAPSTPEPKEDETAAPKSETRRMTRRASASQPSPVTTEGSTSKRSKASLSDTDIEPPKSTPGRRTRKSDSEELVVVSQISAPASPLTRTPGRRGKSAALSVTQLSPIPEKSKSDDPTKSDDDIPVFAAESSPPLPSTPSRLTRRTSVSAASPVILELPKRTRRSSKKDTTEAPTTPMLTSRTTRRSSASSSDVTPNVPAVDVPVRTRSVVKPTKAPADPDSMTLEKTAKATPSRRVSVKAASQPEEITESRRTTRSSSSHDAPEASGSTSRVTRKSVVATSSKTRKSIMIRDPFSPVVGPEVEEDLKEDQKPKRKYVVRKSAKSHKLV
jgi:hypothetical protein